MAAISFIRVTLPELLRIADYLVQCSVTERVQKDMKVFLFKWSNGALWDPNNGWDLKLV